MASKEAVPSNEDDNFEVVLTQEDSRDLLPTKSRLGKLIEVLFWTPTWCQWSDESPPSFTIWHNILFAFAGGFTSANLFYSSPILNILAQDFNTSISGVSAIPSLAQAGGATGLLLVLPLGDVLPKRRFTLTLVLLALLMWIPLCITDNVTVFLVFSYLNALFNGAPQIMLPLVSELSPPARRAQNIAIVASGATLGILIGRILSGIVTEFTSWRNVYWTALGIQIVVFIALWLGMVDYPATNKKSAREIIKGYPKMIWSIVTLYPKHPVLVQASLVSFCTMAALTSYWTTLTFVLSGPRYNYSTIVVGLFGLVAIVPMLSGPLYGKYIVQPLKLPLYSVLVGKTMTIIGIVIGTFSGLYGIGGLIIQGVLQDAGLTVVQISNRMAIYPVEPQARNSVNSAFVCIMYLGQLTGTSVGSLVYEDYGGWEASGIFGIGMILISYVLIALRGPHESGWIGWHGGWGRSDKNAPAEDIESNVVSEPKVPTSMEYDAKDVASKQPT